MRANRERLSRFSALNNHCPSIWPISETVISGQAGFIKFGSMMPQRFSVIDLFGKPSKVSIRSTRFPKQSKRERNRMQNRKDLIPDSRIPGMRNVFGVFIVVLSVMFSGAWASAEQVKKPNIVLFFADDLGWMDLGVQGSTFYETPNLDRLAERGMRFTDAYAACQVCSPTRAALLTGQYPQRVGITDFLGGGNDGKAKRAKERNFKMMPAPQKKHMPEGTVTFADAFKAAGYHTYFLGKWHVGNPQEGFGPLDHGFDVNIGGTARGGPYGRGKYFHPFDLPNIDSKPGDHLTDRTAEEAVKLIKAADGEPFMMYLSFYDVHTPLMAKPELEEKYETKAKKVEHDGARFKPEPPRQARQVQDHAVYGGMVEVMDDAVGTVLAALDELGIADNTIIIFTSDNGGLSTSEGSPTSNVPLRGGKGWMYEGGIRVPAIAYWPGVTQPGSVSSEPIISNDFFPTMLQMASLPLRPEAHLDGVSLVPVLKGEGDIERDAIFFHYPHYGNQGGSPSSAIRQGDWKLLEFFEDGRLELYNLAEDIGETNNLAEQEDTRASAMHQRLKAWRDEVGATYPTPNPDYDASVGRKDRG